jgi:hypothetical protein
MKKENNIGIVFSDPLVTLANSLVEFCLTSCYLFLGLDKQSPGPKKVISDVVKDKTDASSAVQSSSVKIIRDKSVHSAPDPSVQCGRPRVHIPNWGLA